MFVIRITQYIEYLRPSMYNSTRACIAINACRIPAESTINRVLRERLGFVVFIDLLYYCIDIVII